MHTTPQWILTVEDDPSFRSYVSKLLAGQGYSIAEARTGHEALQNLSDDLDVVLLDLGLPDMDGIEVTRRIRQDSLIPIIVLSGRCEQEAIVTALDAGADDYLAKPFSPEELLARINANFRRVMRFRQEHARPPIQLGRLSIDLDARTVRVGEEKVDLTPTEFDLLELLAERAHEIVPHEEILERIWGANFINNRHYVRTYMSYLRSKIERDKDGVRYIKTVKGRGYMLTEPDA